MATFDSREVVRKLSARLKMRHFVLLLQIQQHGSLTRVAEQMATSQPAVTNALSELESMFGTPLFERSPRGMTPTPMGAIVLARAQTVVHDLDHLAREMEAVASGHAAHLHLGVIPFVSGQLLASAIRRARPDHGARLTVTVHEGTSDTLLPRLLDHTLDIVVARALPSIDLGQVSSEVLYHQSPRLIAGRRLGAQLGRKPLDWPKLADLDWILGPPHTPIREQVAQLFLAAGISPPTPIVESYSSKLIGEMLVSSERAVSVVPADIAEELVRIAGVAIVPYTFGWALPPIAMFTRVGAPQREGERLFATTLRQLCQERKPG